MAKDAEAATGKPRAAPAAAAAARAAPAAGRGAAVVVAKTAPAVAARAVPAVAAGAVKGPVAAKLKGAVPGSAVAVRPVAAESLPAASKKAAAPAPVPALSPAQGEKCLNLASAFGGSVQDALSMLVGRPVACAEPTVLAQPPWPEGPAGDKWVVGRAALARAGTSRPTEGVLAVLPFREALVLADLISGGDGTSPADQIGEAQSETLGEALCQAVLAWAPTLGLGGHNRPALDWLGLEVLDGAALEDRLDGGWALAELPWSLDGGGQGRMYLALELGVLEQTRPTQGAGPSEAAAPATLVQPARFAPLSPGGAAAARHGIDILVDVPLQLTVELGRSTRRIKDILALGPGSVVELDKLAGEAVDVLVNGKLIARGEVVVIDENFGIRITDIISPVERLPHLG